MATASTRTLAPPRPQTATGQALMVKGTAQVPIFQRNLSKAAFERLATMDDAEAVQLGVGVRDRRGLSRALPFDEVGMLLAAEWMRRQVAPGGILAILVADEHAKEMGEPADEVAGQAAAVRRTLHVACEALDIPARVVLASELATSGRYKQHYSRVCDGLGAVRNELSAYTVRELADIAYLADVAGAKVKVGWAATDNSNRARAGQFDEPYYDALFEQHVDGSLAFFYTQPGIRLDRKALRAAPYLEREPQARVILKPGEDVARKFALAEEHGEQEAARTYRKLLNAIARMVRSITGIEMTGTVEERTQRILDLVVA